MALEAFIRPVTPADIQLLRRGIEVAAHAARRAIEEHGTRVNLGDGVQWFDVRSMLDRREHSGEVTDENAEYLAYAEQTALVRLHDEQPHLVRFTVAQQLERQG